MVVRWVCIESIGRFPSSRAEFRGCMKAARQSFKAGLLFKFLLPDRLWAPPIVLLLLNGSDLPSQTCPVAAKGCPHF